MSVTMYVYGIYMFVLVPKTEDWHCIHTCILIHVYLHMWGPELGKLLRIVTFHADQHDPTQIKKQTKENVHNHTHTQTYKT